MTQPADIVFDFPTPGSPVGPGVQVEWRVFIPVIPQPGSTWVVSITDTTNEKVVSTQILDFVGGSGENTVQLQLGQVHAGTSIQGQPQYVPAEGETVNIRIGLEEPIGQIAFGQMSGTWTSTGALFQEVGDVTGTQGGLTEEEKLQLQQAAESVVQVVTGVPGTISVPISTLVRLPDRLQLVLDPTPIIFTGPGVIGPSVLQANFVYALWWEFLEVPPELGRRFRTQAEYQFPLLELNEFGTFRNINLSVRITRHATDRVLFELTSPKTQQILVWVFPGVQVAIHPVNWFFGP